MDDTILVLIFAVLFAVGLYRWAEAWGRNGWIFAACSLFLSPLISGVILLVMGRAKEKIDYSNYDNDQVNAVDPAITNARMEEVIQSNDDTIKKLQEEQRHMRSILRKRSNRKKD